MSAPAKPSIDEIREALTVFGDSAESAGVRYEQGDRLGRLNAESEGKQARGVVMDAIDELAAARERIAVLDQLLNNATRLADEEGEARRQLRARVAELEAVKLSNETYIRASMVTEDALRARVAELEGYFNPALTALASWKWLPKVAGIARAALARDGEAGSYAGIHLAAEPMPDLRKIGEATADAVLAKMRRDGEKQHTPDCETNSEPCEYNYQRCTCALARDGGEP